MSMKPPMTYYGGKQNLVPLILPLIPEHQIYVEPFFGGGAVFFAKEPAPVEVINDTDREIVNFYRMCQLHFDDLEAEIQASLHSRSLHQDARIIRSAPHLFSDLKRAWALWVLATQSFAKDLNGGWIFSKSKTSIVTRLNRKKEAFTHAIAERLKGVEIECWDALKMIRARDTATSFFYVDPPYFNANMGHYGGYTEQDFENLLKLLSGIKGKFLLSSYPSSILEQYTQANGWHRICKQQTVSATKKTTVAPRKQKTEVLTANYPLHP